MCIYPCILQKKGEIEPGRWSHENAPSLCFGADIFLRHGLYPLSPMKHGDQLLADPCGTSWPSRWQGSYELISIFSYVNLNPSSCHTQFCQTSARPDRVDSGSPQVCGRSGLYKLKDWLKLKPMPSIEHPKKMISWWLQMAHSHVHSHSHLIDVSTVRCTT
jgi:hypothetical protein